MTIFTDGPRLAPEQKYIEDDPASLGEQLGAVARQTVADSPLATIFSPLPAASGSYKTMRDLMPDSGPPGTMADLLSPQLPNDLNKPIPDELQPPKLDIGQARAMVKQSGLEGRLTLPEQPDISQGALQIMMSHARDRAERDSVISRGPSGVVPSALMLGTSFLVGAADPVNVAASFIPVIGEARYAKLLASAGESALSRAGVRAGVGVASGLAGGVPITALDWLNHTRDGQDYGMAEALHSMIFMGALGGTLHAGGGAVADVWRGRQGKALYPFAENEPFEPKAPPSVYNDVLGQLKASGMDEQEASHNAGIFAARYATRADRLGLEPQAAFDLYKNENLEIRPSNDNAPEGERAYAQSQAAPTFYSSLDNAVTAVKQDKASSEQWLGTLKNTPGVKAEELDWLGVEDWLKEQKVPVTKQQLQDYIRANQVEVKEVTKGARVPPTAEEMADLNALDQRFSDQDMTLKADDAARLAELKMKRDQLPQSEQPAKFTDPKLSLPGGENYRELLLTLPEKPVEIPSAGGLEHLQNGLYLVTAPGGTRETFKTLAEAEAERGRLGRIFNRDRALEADRDNYRSQHFAEANILAHVRFNDRMIDGKKTLFLEEVQSDWHQKGKRQGYQGDVKTNRSVAEIDKDMDANLAELQRREGDGEDNDEAARQRWARHPDLQRSHDTLMRERNAAAGFTDGVPDAPFKTTWPELALKRMIRYAAENGYEKIGWTTGEQQAARYDLSKQIGRLALYEQRGELFLSAWKPNNGDNVMDLKSVTKEELPDIIGKEAADKLLKVKPDRSGHRTLEGIELKVGGEGMKGFYDQILPSTVNKLVKKYGGKVQEGSLGTAEESVLRRKLREHGYDPDTVDAQKVLEDTGGRRPVWLTDNEVDDLSLGLHQDAIEPKNEKVHTLDLTPELKQAALEKGFPLFQKSEAGDIRGRISFGENKKVIELFKASDASTFMHEAGHLWLDELSRDADLEKAPQQIRDDMAAVRAWLGAKEGEEISVAQHEQWARGFEQYLADGQAPSKGLAAAFERFKDWLKAIYHNLTRLGAPVSDDIKGVMDRMLATDKDIAARLDDLPPRAKEDAMRMAVANLIGGEPVRVGEMLNAAAEIDPRLAESLNPHDTGAITARGAPEREAAIKRFWDETAAAKPDYDAPEAVALSKQAEALPDFAKSKLDQRLAAALKEEKISDDLYQMFEASLPEEQRLRLADSLAAIDEEALTREQVLRRGLNCMLLPV